VNFKLYIVQLSASPVPFEWPQKSAKDAKLQQEDAQSSVPIAFFSFAMQSYKTLSFMLVFLKGLS